MDQVVVVVHGKLLVVSVVDATGLLHQMDMVMMEEMVVLDPMVRWWRWWCRWCWERWELSLGTSGHGGTGVQLLNNIRS